MILAAPATAQLDPRQEGIEIEQSSFDSLCAAIMAYDSSHCLSREEAIVAIRVSNTIEKDSILTESFYHIQLFKKIHKNYFDRIIEILEFKVGIGLCYYSKIYDIRIGGYYIIEKNSLYKIKRN